MFLIYASIAIAVLSLAITKYVSWKGYKNKYAEWEAAHAAWEEERDAEKNKAYPKSSLWYREPRKPIDDSSFYLIPSGFISIVVAVFLMLFMAPVAYNAVKVPDVTYSDLATLNDGSGVQGSFFLGSGTINSTAVFMYYTNDNGVYRLNHVDADYATVTYTDGPPRLLYHNTKSGNHFWALDWFGDDYTQYEFQVPAGSVKQSFNLDAQ